VKRTSRVQRRALGIIRVRVSDAMREELVLDSREPASLEEYLKRHGITYRKEELAVGDILVGEILIERKELRNLLNSQKTGQLYYQIRALRESIEDGFRPLVLIEGRVPPLVYETRGLWKRIYSLVLSYWLMDIHTIIVESKEEIATLLRLLIDRLGRPTSRRPRLSLRGKAKSSLTANEVKEDILRTVPTIGSITARRVLKKKGSIAKLVEELKKDSSSLREILTDKNIAKLKEAFLGTYRVRKRKGGMVWKRS